MAFDNFASAQSFFLWSVFAIAFILGLVVNKTNFCTMGAVSDWVNMGDKGRFRAWFLAIAIVLLGVVLLEYFGVMSVDGAFPPYRSGQLIWAENLLGGIIFGIGMTFASGCGNKTLIRLGGGNTKSIFVIFIIGIIAYFMINPFPGTDQTLFTILFYPWIRPLAIDVGAGQDLGTLIAGTEGALTTRLIIGLILGVGLIWFAFKSLEFRKNSDHVISGLVVGLCVLAAWYVTATTVVDLDGDTHSLKDYVQQWEFLAEDSDAVQPADSRPLSAQSFTFINPLGQTLGYAASGFDFSLVTFGVMAVLGVIFGSFVWAIITKSFRIEWFANAKDFFVHVIGAVMMGLGGVLAMGCTVGQAITGVSTLAVGSFIAFAGIVLGSAMTMKIQYYKLVYEEEATFGKAFITGLVDLKLLPESMRKLENI